MTLSIEGGLVQAKTGGFNDTSGATTLDAATTAGNTLVVVAFTYGTSGIATPAGYTSRTTPATTQKLYVFDKVRVGDGETLPTLGTFAGAQPCAWWVMERDDIDPDYPVDLVSALATANATSIANNPLSSGGLSYDSLVLIPYGAANTADAAVPTWTPSSLSLMELADQGAAAAGQAVGLGIAAYATPRRIIHTHTSVSSLAADGPLAAGAVKYHAAGGGLALDVRNFWGFEQGTAAGLATGPTGYRHMASVTGGVSIVATTPRSGDYCLQVTAAAGISNALSEAVTISSGKRAWSILFPFYAPGGLPGADTEIGSLEVTGPGHAVKLRYRQATGKLGVQIGTGAEQVSAGTLSADTWYVLELRYDGTTAGAHTVDWRLDWTDQPQATGPGAAATDLAIRWGSAVSGTYTWLYDDTVLTASAGNYPLGNYKIVPLTVDPAGTLTVSGTAANFGVMTANGTIGAWNATNARNAIDERPPTIGAAADGLVATVDDGISYVLIPMSSYTLAADEAVRSTKMMVAGWAAATQANSITLSAIPDGQGLPPTVLWGPADPNFDNSTTAPGWICALYSPTAAWTQTLLNALAHRFAALDATPDPGMHALYTEVLVAIGTSIPVFGGDGPLRVAQITDQTTGGIMTLRVYTPVGQTATLKYEVDGTPTTVNVAAGANPHTVSIQATDASVVNRIELIPG